MNAITLQATAPAMNFGDELAKWFNRGAELAANGLDCHDLDIFVHDRAAVPDAGAAMTVLRGYYAQKRATFTYAGFGGLGT